MVTSTGTMPTFFTVSRAARSTSVAGSPSSSGGNSRRANLPPWLLHRSPACWVRSKHRCLRPVIASSTSKGVLDAACHRAQLIERPAQGHRAGPRDSAVGRPQAGNSAAHAGAYDAAASLAADGKSPPARGRCRLRVPRLNLTILLRAARDFFVCPPNHTSFIARAPMLSLAISTRRPGAGA